MPKFLLAAALAAIPAAAADCAVDYQFRADWSGDTRRFDASVSFDTGDRTSSRVRLPSEWGGVADFHRGIANVRVEGEGLSVAQDDAPNRWLVKHPPGKRVTVRYDVINAMPGVDGTAGMNHRDFYRNVLGATRFQLFGHGVLLQPEHFRDGEPVAVCYTFSGLAPGWSFASNDGAGHVDGTAAWRVVAAPYQHRSSLYLGGDYRLHRRDVAGRPLWIAMRGSWRFEDAVFVDASARVVESQRRFWNDLEFPHYLISLSPNRVASGSTGGTALRNTFAMHASDDFSVPGASFEHILAHEHLHTWVPRRLGTMGEGESARYWFSEGFTDYLTHRLLLTSGLWKLEDYARALNNTVRQYLESPAVDYPNARVAEEFWRTAQAQRIPYFRGELFALHLSRRLAAAGTSLDAILRGLLLDASAVREGSGPESLAVNRLRAATRVHIGDVDADFEAFIEAGKRLPLGVDFLGDCFQGRSVELPRYELGFDGDRLTQTRRITGLVRGSAADRAGLRDGDVVRSWSIYGGNIERDVELLVWGDDGFLKDVRYRPVAAVPLRAPQFSVKPGAAENVACKRWLQ